MRVDFAIMVLRKQNRKCTRHVDPYDNKASYTNFLQANISMLSNFFLDKGRGPRACK